MTIQRSSSWAINYTDAQAKPQQENQPATFGSFHIFKVNLLPKQILSEGSPCQGDSV